MSTQGGTAEKLAPKAAEQVPLQPASLDIWDSKYRLRDQDGKALDDDIEACRRRVAKALAAMEEPAQQDHWYREFLWALEHGATPAGRIWSNAGAEAYKPETSTINCTVSATIPDSMDGIMSCLHAAAMTLKGGSGIGYDFSTLRPRGATVRGAGAQTSGPLSFMDVFDAMCFTVSSAGGRRGAQMGVMDIGHPDIETFITAKHEDGRLRQFNLSVLVRDEFIEAVRDGADWALAFPATRAEREATDPEIIYRHYPATGGDEWHDKQGRTALKVYARKPARELWDLIMRSSYERAEPGFILIDQVNALNNNWFCESIRASNPCVTADTWVQTSLGPRQVRDLRAQPFMAQIDGEQHASAPEGFFATGNKAVFRLETREGYQLRLTADHRLRRLRQATDDANDWEWCAASELQAGDRLLLNDLREAPEWDGPLDAAQGYLLGLLVADDRSGHQAARPRASMPARAASAPLAATANALRPAMRPATNAPLQPVLPGVSSAIESDDLKMTLAELGELAASLGMSSRCRTITPALEAASSAAYRGFLQRLFDADADVHDDGRGDGHVGLVQSDIRQLQAVQRMLLRLGIPSIISRCRSRRVETAWPDKPGDGRFHLIKPNHELIIRDEGLLHFKTRIGFSDPAKAEQLHRVTGGDYQASGRAHFVAEVTDLVADGRETVYDVQIPGVNAFDANGFIAHNCGEQPLPPNGACLLGSVNLTGFIREPFSQQARFDWERYRRCVEIFSRMLDNVVEINGLPLEAQQREIKEKRRHGMGFFGLGSALCMLGLRYGSDGACEFTEQVSKELALAGWRQALVLAREKGPAPLLQREFEVTEAMLHARPEMRRDGIQVGDKLPGRILHARYSRYMQRLAELDPELVEALAAVGARYTHHSSIAPTGTIALSFGNNASNGIEPSFSHHYYRNVIRPGRKTKERVDVLSFELLAYRHFVNAETSVEKLPADFTSSEQLEPSDHLKVQAAAQHWVDSAISKTINCPTEIGFEAFKNIYWLGIELGLKGCTTFRYNPEVFQGVLVRKDEAEATRYAFTLEDGSTLEYRGDELIEYDGEIHTAANLFDAIKEGYYGRL